MGRLEGRSIIITGAGSGIGRSAAAVFAREGASLTLADISPAALEGTQDYLNQTVGECPSVSVVADVTRASDVDEYVDKSLSTYGRVDGFFNNAGVEATFELLEDIDTDALHAVLGVNLIGAYLGLRRVLKVMRSQGHGAVVNTTSVAGMRGFARQGAYVASKHGVVGLTRTAALEYGQFGVRVNAVAPGSVATAMSERSYRRIAGDDWSTAVAQTAASNPMRRRAEPDDIARAAAFLLSDDASFINGVVLPVDGGHSVQGW